MSNNSLKWACFVIGFLLGVVGLGWFSLATHNRSVKQSIQPGGGKTSPIQPGGMGHQQADEFALGISIKDFPLFLAPLIVAWNSISVFLFYMIKIIEDKKKLVTGASLVYTALLCSSLTQFHAWDEHLTLMAALFFGFVAWDRYMLIGQIDDEFRKEIEAGNLQVNIPTLIALLAVSVYVSVFHTQLSSSADDMVRGLIIFHLTFAAVGYFLIFCELVHFPRKIANKIMNCAKSTWQRFQKKQNPQSSTP